MEELEQKIKQQNESSQKREQAAQSLTVQIQKITDEIKELKETALVECEPRTTNINSEKNSIPKNSLSEYKEMISALHNQYENETKKYNKEICEAKNLLDDLKFNYQEITKVFF